MDFVNILIAAVLCSLMFLALWQVRELALRPERSCKNADMSIVVRPCNGTGELEQNIKHLCVLRDNGKLNAEIIIDISEADKELSDAARLLSLQHDGIRVAELYSKYF